MPVPLFAFVGPEVVVVIVLLLLLFGPKYLPKLGRSLGVAPEKFSEARQESDPDNDD
jgi:sec-independent protein translocase protein TatA